MYSQKQLQVAKKQDARREEAFLDNPSTFVDDACEGFLRLEEIVMHVAKDLLATFFKVCDAEIYLRIAQRVWVSGTEGCEYTLCMSAV
jgi:hypothetical protein